MSDTTHTLASDIGLLDVEETVHGQVKLEGEGRDSGPYPPGSFTKIVSAMITLVFCIVATYVVPALHFARPWTSADPVPFWNIIGREILGEGEAAEVEQEEALKAEELATRL